MHSNFRWGWAMFRSGLGKESVLRIFQKSTLCFLSRENSHWLWLLLVYKVRVWNRMEEETTNVPGWIEKLPVKLHRALGYQMSIEGPGLSVPLPSEAAGFLKTFICAILKCAKPLSFSPKFTDGKLWWFSSVDMANSKACHLRSVLVYIWLKQTDFYLIDYIWSTCCLLTSDLFLCFIFRWGLTL